MQDPSVKVDLPGTYAQFDLPPMVYIVMNRIRSKTFIFNKFVKNLDMKTFLDDNFTLLCDGTVYPFVEKILNKFRVVT